MIKLYRSQLWPKYTNYTETIHSEYIILVFNLGTKYKKKIWKKNAWMLDKDLKCKDQQKCQNGQNILFFVWFLILSWYYTICRVTPTLFCDILEADFCIAIVAFFFTMNNG